jgi:Uncharacterised nucleotidyltransferase
VRRAPGQEIVDFLSFSAAAKHDLAGLRNFRERDWRRASKWLDDAGLAFYFLRKLKQTNARDAVPDGVINRLEQSFADNQQRVGEMSHRFDSLNRKFNDAGVRYAVLKGLSLIPEYCPDANLRHQGDFDYLVDDHSLSTAQRIVVDAGYNPKPSTSSQEYIFVSQRTATATRSPEQYSARSPHAVELHLDIWDSEQHGLPSMPGLFSVDRTRIHHWNGLTFPGLPDEEAFLLQVLHACQHLFTYWIRMSSLLEIGFFLQQRSSDASLWNRVEQRVSGNLMLREFVVVITELVAKLFAAPIPLPIRVWGLNIRPATRVWIESYARHCAFCEIPSYELSFLPKAKLVLFLHRQYENTGLREPRARNRLIKFPRLSRMALSIKEKPSLVLNASWWKRQLFIRRSLFHTLAGLRYLCEIPRWRWLNRTKLRPVSPTL